MTRHASRRALASVAGMTLAGCLGLLLTACGSSDGGGGGGGTPTFGEDGLALDYPGDWIKDRAGGQGLVLNVHSRPRRGDRLFTRVTLFRQRKEFATLEAYGRILKDDRSLTVKGPGPAKLSDVKLADGTEARRIVTVTDVRKKTGGTVPYELRETLAIAGGEQFRLTIFTPQDDAGSPAVQRIERSLKVPRSR